MTTETTVATLKKKKKQKPSDSPQDEPRLHQPFKLVFVKAKSLLVPSLAAAVGYTVAPGEAAIDHIPASRGSRCRIARQDAAGRVRGAGGGGGEGNKTRLCALTLSAALQGFFSRRHKNKRGKWEKRARPRRPFSGRLSAPVGGGGGRREVTCSVTTGGSR